MIRTSSLVVVLMVGVFISCGKQSAGDEKQGFNTTLKAVISEQTKASVTNSGIVSWQVGDEVKVWTTAGSAKPFSVTTIEGGVATLEGNLDAGEKADLVAVYPYSALRALSSTTATIAYTSTYSYQSQAMQAPMAAILDGSDVLHFRQLGGMVQVQCPSAGIPSAATQFYLVANGNKIGGLFDGIEVCDGMAVQSPSISDNSRVIVSFTNDGLDKAFNVPIPSGTYHSIYAAFADAAGNKIREWQVLTDVTVERGDMYVRTMPSDMLRVMSFNIRFAHDEDGYSAGDGRLWSERKLVVPGALEKRYFDVMGSQENTTQQISDILSSLSGYYAVGKSNHDKAISDLGYTSTYETSAIYYRTSATVLGSGSFDISQTNTRRCNWVKLNYAGRDFYVFNAHLQVGETASNATERKTQAAAILTEIKKYSSSYPVIWTGDFNCWDASADDVVKYVIDDGTMRDTRAGALNPHGSSGTLHYFQADNPTTHRLDYVFVNDKFVVQSFWIDNSQQKNAPAWESDHNPVIVDLSWSE